MARQSKADKLIEGSSKPSKFVQIAASSQIIALDDKGQVWSWTTDTSSADDRSYDWRPLKKQDKKPTENNRALEHFLSGAPMKDFEE